MHLRTTKEIIYYRLGGLWIDFNPKILHYGVRFHLPNFLKDLLNYMGISLSELVPNSFIHINRFISHYHQLHIQHNITLFAQYFSVGESKLPPTRNFIIRRTAQSWMPTPTSNIGWHNKCTFISGENLLDLPRWSSMVQRRHLIIKPHPPRRSKNKSEPLIESHA